MLSGPNLLWVWLCNLAPGCIHEQCSQALTYYGYGYATQHQAVYNEGGGAAVLGVVTHEHNLGLGLGLETGLGLGLGLGVGVGVGLGFGLGSHPYTTTNTTAVGLRHTDGEH